jgi:hypothetical protein
LGVEFPESWAVSIQPEMPNASTANIAFVVVFMFMFSFRSIVLSCQSALIVAPRYASERAKGN